MKRNVIIKVLCFGISALLISCKGKNRLTEYEAIKSLAIQSNSLYKTVQDYDIKHPDFFESKVDLMSLWILSNNYEKADEFSKRAEVLITKSVSKEYLCNYYGLKASVLLKNKNYEESLSWVQKATSMKTIGNKYRFLEGQILFAMKEKEKSLITLKKAFTEDLKNAGAEDKKLYAVLLLENEEYDESIIWINKLFEEGNYYYGLGQIASKIYEKKNMLFESILYAYMDYEYASCFFQNSDNQFLKNLQLLKMKYEGKNESQDVNKAVEIITSSIKPEMKKNNPIKANCFIHRYLSLKNKILTKTEDEENLSEILSLKNYFEMFPSYHYLVAETFMNQKINFTPIECYENILAISSENRYSDYARIALGRSLGLNETESKKILSFSEVKKLINRIINSPSEKEINAICNLLSLPDNKYVFYAEEYLKANKTTESVFNILKEKHRISEGRLKERLDYVIYQ